MENNFANLVEMIKSISKEDKERRVDVSFREVSDRRKA